MAFGTPVSGGIVYSGVANLISAVCPATVNAGDALVLIIGHKPSSANVNTGTASTPAGWTKRAELIGAGGYGTTAGADVGNCNLWIFTKDTVDGTEGGTTISSTLTVTSAAWGLVVRVPTGGGRLTYNATTGQQSTAPSTSISVTMSADPGFSARDFALWAMAIPTDTDTPALFSGHTITATGATFGSASEISEPDSTTNNDIGGVIAYATVSSGTSSAAPVIGATLTGTQTADARGPLGLLRIREDPVGSLSATLGALTSSGTGTVSNSGALSATLGEVTLSASGGVRVTGTASNTLGALTLSSAGIVLPVISGSLSATLGALTATVDGAVRVTGAASNTLGAVTLASSGTVVASLNGSLTATLGALTSSAAGIVSVTGDLAKTLGAVALSAAGQVRVTGDQSSTLGELTATAAGTVTNTGMLAVTLGDLQADASGGVLVVGAASISLGALTATGEASALVSGTAGITLGGLSLTAAGNVSNENHGRLDVTLGELVLSATVDLYTFIPNPDRTVRIRAASRTFTAKKSRGYEMMNMGPDGRRWTPHSPGADLDYIENWSEWLGDGETVEQSQWTATAGITLSRQTVLNGTHACVFAAGGVAGQVYELTNTITTSQGRIDSRTITLRCQPQ